MKDIINRWLQARARVPGVLAWGVRHSDKTSVSRSWSDAYPQETLENAWRCVSDTFQVLKLHRLPTERLRWVYENALLYCVQRADGACLSFFTPRDPHAVDLGGLAQLMEEFYSLGSNAKH
jgi:hypothetical protein